VRAGLTSIKMFMDHDPLDFDGKLRILEEAKRFFQEGVTVKSPSIPGAGAVLPDADVSKYAQTTNLQIAVTSFFQSQGKNVPPAVHKSVCLALQVKKRRSQNNSLCYIISL